MFRLDRVAKGDQLGFLADVGTKGGDTGARRRLREAQLAGLRHVLFGDIAYRHMHAGGAELACELTAHAGAATGDDGDLIGFDLHLRVLVSIGRGVRRSPAGDSKTEAQLLQALGQLNGAQVAMTRTDDSGRRSAGRPDRNRRE